MTEKSYTKAQRLSRMNHFLYRNPQGLSAAELARLCGVHKRTIQRDLHDLENMGVPLWDDEGDPPRYGVISGYFLQAIHLSLNDALALYLASRLLARQAELYDPHIVSALSKLAGILPEPMARHIHAAIRQMIGFQDSHLTQVLETLATAWATGRVARIRYQASGSENVHGYRLKPYFIEACGDYRGTYVIGWADYFDAIHTFRVERILEAELTEETFELPDEFDGPQLMRNAWGVMFGDECQDVVLRFAPEAFRRVHETCWHPSQSLAEESDGSCTLRLQVAHPREMLYWIRGWGPLVEVLEPASLREQVAAEALATAAMYDGHSE
jgi:predicted DNA-binding transcriptional regulator YafY